MSASFTVRGVEWKQTGRGAYKAVIDGVIAIEIHTLGPRKYYECWSVSLVNQTLPDEFTSEQCAEFAFDACHLRASVLCDAFKECLARSEEKTK